jgi:hypothetical protein
MFLDIAAELGGVFGKTPNNELDQDGWAEGNVSILLGMNH